MIDIYDASAHEMLKRSNITRSDFVQAVIMFKGKPLSYRDFPFWPDIVNSKRICKDPNIVDVSDRRIVVQSSRQVAKTSNVGFLSIELAIENKYINIIICQPTDVQISRFSVEVIKQIIDDSPITNTLYFNKKKNQSQVKNKSFATGSRIVLANIYASTRSIRGIPGAILFLDEVQDLREENIIIVMEALSRSPYGYIFLTGTPKDHNNVLNRYYLKSTQKEWAVRCQKTGCKEWNVGLNEANIGEKDIVCRYCGKPLGHAIRFGQWVTTGKEDSQYDGYHINELMIPRDSALCSSIKTIRAKQRDYPRAKFYNEVLGLPYDDNTYPITMKEIQEICDPKHLLMTEDEMESFTPSPSELFFAGLDWATTMRPTGASDDNVKKSYTVLTVEKFANGRLTPVYIRRYAERGDGMEADDPEWVLNHIIRVLLKFNVLACGADHGAGHKENQRIKKVLGDRLIEFLYVSQSHKAVWDPIELKMHIDRTRAIDDLLDGIKGTNGVERRYRFPKFEGHTSEYANDLTTVYKFNSKHNNKKMYDHTDPDDWMHSLIFAELAYELYMEILEYY